MRFQVELIGRGASDNFPANVMSYPIVTSGTHPDFEAIAKSGAQAVLYDPQTISASDIEKLKQMGLVTIPVGGNSFEAWKDSMYKAASIMGAESFVSDYISDDIDKNIERAKTDLAGKSSKVAILMAGKGSEDWIEGTNSFLGDMLRQIGQTPVGPDATEFVTMNAETLIKDNPDVIIVAGNPKPVAADPRLAGLTAVKERHVYGLDQDVLLRQGSRIDELCQDFDAAILKSRS